jgi:hypothetical protein
MSEENSNQTEQTEEIESPENGAEETSEPAAAVQGRRFFTRRNAVVTSGILGILLVLLAILVVVF